MEIDTATSRSFDPAVIAARQVLYRFAAISLLDPKAGTWQQLGAMRGDPLLPEAARMICSLPDAKPKELALGERPHTELDPAKVLDKLPNSPEALNDQYENTFGLLVSNACPPYETEFINSNLTFQRSNELADISGFYAAFGLTTSIEHPERPDHIVLELEFMAFLLSLERLAREENSNLRAERLQICRTAQQRFLKDHLAWWVPAFAKLLGRENPSGFYDAVGEFLSALIPAERALLHVNPASQPAPTPSQPERPEQCEGCQLASS